MRKVGSLDLNNLSRSARLQSADSGDSVKGFEHYPDESIS